MPIKFRWASMTDNSLAANGSFRNKPRRRFTTEYKRQVVQALLVSSDSMAQVARDHDLNHNQLARWRQEFLQGRFNEVCAPPSRAMPSLVPVALVASQHLPVQAKSYDGPRTASTSLELRLPKGTLVINAELDGSILRELIEALQ